MLFLLILCSACAFLVSALVIRLGIVHAHDGHTPQRFHSGHVPRLGGIGMFIACTVGWGWMASSEYLQLPNLIRFDWWMAFCLWAATALTWAGGVYEDLTQRVRAVYRLLLTLISAVIVVTALDLQVPRLGIVGLDYLWSLAVLPGTLLAIFAIAGLPHAFNLIDGYNGLAGIVALISCFALAYVALQVGDRQLAAIVLVLAGSTTGFLVWNYPRGLIFAGDGGAYVWGMVIAICSVLLVQRHPAVSPWFPILLLIYPVWETFFSIYRKASKGQSPGVADALHFHQLIFRRIVREVFHDDEARRMLIRNNRTSPYLWGFTLLTVLPAVLFWNQTIVLVMFCAVFIVFYVWAYISIIRFKVPRWLRR
jgi:UDP-GlcNAc:undecaprenyl-phosphate/decaprenyl-phosphate GlcNAc-1-phosphate transferase